jgi:sugar phosphate isomerase/epimerase
MNDQIFVSTSSFCERDLTKIIESAERYNITNIELSICNKIRESDIAYLHQKQANVGFRYLIHNYFPQPSVPFTLNIASLNPLVRARSMDLAKNAIDICAKLRAPFYSLHSGFYYDPAPEELGGILRPPILFPKDKSDEMFISNLEELILYGEDLQVKIAIENNVLSKSNINTSCLMGVTINDLFTIQDSLQGKLYFLIDVGHLNVSAQTLGLSRQDFLARISDDVVAFHLSENEGVTDDNLEISHKSWFMDFISRIDPIKKIILEIKQSSIERIKSQVDILEQGLRG